MYGQARRSGEGRKDQRGGLTHGMTARPRRRPPKKNAPANERHGRKSMRSQGAWPARVSRLHSHRTLLTTTVDMQEACGTSTIRQHTNIMHACGRTARGEAPNGGRGEGEAHIVVQQVDNRLPCKPDSTLSASYSHCASVCRTVCTVNNIPCVHLK